MDFSINERHQEHIKRKVASGKYGTPDAVLDEALKLLDEHDEALEGELADVRAKVQEGTDQLKSGDYLEYTEESLDAVLEDIEAEALSDLEPQRPHAD